MDSKFSKFKIMKKILLFTALLALFAVGCQKEVIDNSQLSGNSSVVFDAVIDDDTHDTKVAVNHDALGKKISFAWEKNDAGHTDAFTLYKYNSGVSEYVGTFTYSGIGNRFENSSGLTVESGNYIAVMPAVTKEECPTLNDWEDRALDITSQMQDATIGHLNKAVRLKSDEFTFDATSNTPLPITFRHVLAIVQFNFTMDADEAPRKVRLSYDNYIEMNYTMNYSGTKEADNSYSTYFMIYPSGNGTTSRDLKFTITTSENKERIIIVAAPNKYEAGKYYVANVGAVEQTSDFIKITTKGEFERIGAAGELTFTLDKKYILMNDIHLGGSTANHWTPIGKQGAAFTGVFDGNGKSIHGLYLNNTSGEYQGLFGYLGDDAVVKNVALRNPVIYGGKNVGAIAGFSGGAKIQNCSVIGGSVKGTDKVGGIVGEIVRYAYIEGCVNDAAVSADNNVGGIAGVGSESSIFGSYNRGLVSSTGSNVGGIIAGSNNIPGFQSLITIVGCYNIGSVFGHNGVGGIAGRLEGRDKIIGCYNTGTITGSADSPNVGELMGYLRSDVHGSPFVDDCYFIGNKGIGNVSENSVAGEYESVTDIYTMNTNPDIINKMNGAIVDYNNTHTLGLAYKAGFVPSGNYNECLPPNLVPVSGTNYVTPIYSITELRNIRCNDPNVKYILMSDITLASSQTPIGDAANPFRGTFDGNGNKIIDLSVVSADGNAGLFGVTDGAVIMNLTIEGPVITGENSAGAFVGVAKNSYFANCGVSGGTIESNMAGGLVGASYGSIFFNSTITNITNINVIVGSQDAATVIK